MATKSKERHNQDIAENLGFGRPLLLQRIIFIGVVFIVLFALYHFNYLLFHSAVEIFGVVIAAAIFILAWNARPFLSNTYFSLLGAGYLVVALLDFLHAFAYPGMNIFVHVPLDAGVQLWIGARGVEGLTLLISMLCLDRAINSRLPLAAFLGIFGLLIGSILVWPVFPTCYVPGVGLTPFKIGSEFAIIFVLLAAFWILHHKRQFMESYTWWLLSGALWMTIAAEMVFTLYTDAYGLLNVVGHYLKFVSIYLIYMAIVEAGFMQPFGLVTHALKKKDAVVKEIDDQFRLLADIVDGVFWIASIQMDRFFYISPGFEKLWQRSCEELYEDAGALEQTIHPEDRQRVMTFTKLDAKGRWEIDFRIITPGDDIRWVHNHGYVIKDADGKITRLCGMAHDITSQKQLEEKLLQSRKTLRQRVKSRTKALSTAIGYLKAQVKEKTQIGHRLKERNLMLHTLVRSIPDMVSYKDTEGRYLISNPAHREFFGFKGKPVFGLTDGELKQDGDAKQCAEREDLVLKKGRPVRFESPLMSFNGRSSVWDIRKIPVKGEDGNCVGILSLSREITEFKQRELELKQSQSLLQAFLNGISDPMLMVDKNLQVLYLNRAASVEYSIATDSDDRRSCSGILCDGTGGCETCQLETFMSRKEPVRFERHRTDKERVDEVYFYPLFEERDGLDGAVVKIADITKSKQVERHLAHSEKMSALGMLVAGMVHEINNPNSFISFNIPILRAYLGRIFKILDTHPKAVNEKDWFGMDYPAFRKELYSLLENLSHGSSRIDNIIANLKSMIHPKHSADSRKWVYIDGVIEKAVVLCRGEIRKRVKVFEVCASHYAIQARTDPEALEQVVINLLINAAHAADKQDSWVKIETRESRSLPDHAVIKISDNGCGMDRKTMTRIFDPFFTTKGPGVGTGLGLSVSYSLVDQLGGEIVVSSRPGKGSSFKVILPYEPVVEKKEPNHGDRVEEAEDNNRYRALN